MLLFIVLLLLVIFLVFRFRFASREDYRSIKSPSFLRVSLDQKNQDSGSSYFAGKTIVVCALVRDAAKNLDQTLSQVYNLVYLFKDYRIVILENDSKDQTREILLAHANNDPKFIVLGCGINAKECKLNLPTTDYVNGSMSNERISKMVNLRNQYLEFVETKFGSFDLMAVWDLDINGHIYLDGVLDTGALFSVDETQAKMSGTFKVDGVAAQGFRLIECLGGSILTHGDSYAYMDKSLKDLPKRARALFLSLFPGYPYKTQPVESAFNGLTFYRMGSLKGRRYGTWVDEHGEVVCEHRGLHKGLNMWINQRMVHIMVNY
jgi:Glycosyl transferase family 2